MSNFAAMTIALDAIYGALEAPRKDLSSSTEGRAGCHTGGTVAVNQYLRQSSSPHQAGSAQFNHHGDILPKVREAAPVSRETTGTSFSCTACRDKGGYYEYTQGYRNFDPCCYCAPVDPVRDILADDKEVQS